MPFLNIIQLRKMKKKKNIGQSEIGGFLGLPMLDCDQQADYGPRSWTIMRPLPCHLLPLLGEGFLPIQGGQPAILGKGDWPHPGPVWPGPLVYLSTKPGNLPGGQDGPLGAGCQGRRRVDSG